MSNSIKMTLEYDKTDFTRSQKIADIPATLAADADAVRSAILAVNASLSAGTSGGMNTFFRSDDYDATDSANVIGKLKKISAAQIVTENVTNINLDYDTEGDTTNG